MRNQLVLNEGPNGLHVAKCSSSLTSWQHVTWLTTLPPCFLFLQCWSHSFLSLCHRDSSHLQALNTISVLMIPGCHFKPDFSQDSRLISNHLLIHLLGSLIKTLKLT